MQLQDIPYSAKISRVFNFNENFLTRDVHARYAVNSRNYFNEIFKNRYSRKFRRYTVCTCMYQHVQSSSVIVWFPDPSCMGGAVSPRPYRKGLGTKLAQWWSQLQQYIPSCSSTIPVLVCSEEELYKAWVYAVLHEVLASTQSAVL